MTFDQFHALAALARLQENSKAYKGAWLFFMQFNQSLIQQGVFDCGRRCLEFDRHPVGNLAVAYWSFGKAF